jgi:hypothetical protein
MGSFPVEDHSFFGYVVVHAIDGTAHAFMDCLVRHDEVDGHAQAGYSLPEFGASGEIAVREDDGEVEIAVFVLGTASARSEGDDFDRVGSGDEALKSSPDLFFGYGPGEVSGLWACRGHGEGFGASIP